MLVSVALFALIIISMSQMFGAFVRNYQSSRDIQKNLEDAQQLIDTMSKLIRSSTLVSPTSSGVVSTIRFFEASQSGSNNCIVYWFDGSNGSNMLKTNAAPASDANACASATISMGSGSGSNVINTNNSASVTGNFYVGGGTIKTVTISANLQQGQVTSNGIVTVPIQSTVSLRD